MVFVTEKQNHLKKIIEGKASIVGNFSEEVDEEESTVNKVGVHNFRHPIKNPLFFYFRKYYGQNSPLLSH
jgi:hypothetical protein